MQRDSQLLSYSLQQMYELPDHEMGDQKALHFFVGHSTAFLYREYNMAPDITRQLREDLRKTSSCASVEVLIPASAWKD
jgi:hypothetical protein